MFAASITSVCAGLWNTQLLSVLDHLGCGYWWIFTPNTPSMVRTFCSTIGRPGIDQ